ncbi:MAG: hypothetical protein AAF198_02120 [Pseudomonadota bacterium]
MKNLLIAVSTAAFLASQGVAGGLDEPVVDAVDVAAAPATSAAWIIPLVAVALVALAVSGSDDDDDDSINCELEENFWLEECQRR